MTTRPGVPTVRGGTASTRQPSLYGPEPGLYAEVGVPAPVVGTFCYRVPERFEDLVRPGVRVRVTFSGRRLVGVVTSVTAAPSPEVDPQRVREITDCLDRRPVITEQMLVLAAEVAGQCLVGIGEILQLCLPAGGAASVGGRRVRAASLAPAAEGVPSRLRRALASGPPREWVTFAGLERRAGERDVQGDLLALAERGVVEVRDEWDVEITRSGSAIVKLASGVDEEAAHTATSRAPAQRRALDLLLRAPERERAQRRVAAEANVGAAVFRALEAKGLVERGRRGASLPDSGLGAGGAGTFELTPDQSAALAAARAAMDAGAPQPLLLHGVTGSGKTEIYLRAALHALSRGRTALLLVPEIGLTPQLEERARAVLGSSVAVLHSGMSAGQRQRAWWRARKGEARVVVGPRSAVFAPLSRLGLVVIDEEQDGAYKQDERPRYGGRQVALLRARADGALAVLGSATPAVESYYLARRGDWGLARLPRRVGGRSMPQVSLVDMRAEWRESGRTLLSRRLEESVEQRLQRGEQVLILLNRRGFASALVCRACGERSECPHCAVSLTLHRQDRTLRCHYCDHRQAVGGICAACGASALHELGHGTERLQDALRQVFPRASVERFDADQTQRRGAHGRILARFAGGEIDVLVGTQMLAKGHDFPQVTLVGVIGADSSLGVPDFRSAERTFQLLTQMAGRAGRGDIGGEVILQAHMPDHYAIRAALEHDYESFYERELGYRERLRYPPFSALAVCVCRGKLAASVKEEADRLASALRSAPGVRVLGPASPPIGRLRGKYRLQILVKAADLDTVRAALGATLQSMVAAGTVPRDLVVDVDPVNLM